jgi:hypothetical protein
VSIVREADALQAVALLRTGATGPTTGRAIRAAVPLGPGESPGLAARALALRVLAPQLELAPAELAIEKRGRVPELRLRGAPLAATLSLSHHGRYVGFACWLPGRAEAA